MDDAAAFRSALPFPHIVNDHAIMLAVVKWINEEWPREGWKSFRHKNSDKRASHNPEFFGRTTRSVFDSLNGLDFLIKLRQMTGIEDLSADPSLLGGGLHETLHGGFLNIHADFNIHPETKLYRRLNLLLYLNEDWREEWGGQLELWQRDKSGCALRLTPIAGRMVIFATSDSSFHGHPTPVNCPGDRSRRSIALYYYSAKPAEERPVEHSTLYLGDEANWFAKQTA